MPLLRLVASQYPPMWIQTADLLEDFGKTEEASDALRGFIEYSNDNAAKKSTWERLARLYAAHGRLTDELQARLELVEYAEIDYSEISNTANKFNSVLSLARDSQDFQIGENEKRQIAQTLIALMEERASEATATDFSRLGWLYIHIGEKEKAARAADRGLELDESNDYCLKLRKSIWW